MHPLVKTLIYVVSAFVIAALIIWLAPEFIPYLAVLTCFGIVGWAIFTR